MFLEFVQSSKCKFCTSNTVFSTYINELHQVNGNLMVLLIMHHAADFFNAFIRQFLAKYTN